MLKDNPTLGRIVLVALVVLIGIPVVLSIQADREREADYDRLVCQEFNDC